MPMPRSNPSLQEPGGSLRIKWKDTQTVVLVISGVWRFSRKLPRVDEIWPHFSGEGSLPQTVVIDCQELTDWDSGLLTFLINLQKRCDPFRIHLDRSGLPLEVTHLLSLAANNPFPVSRATGPTPHSIFLDLGQKTIQIWQQVSSFLSFLGETFLAVATLLQGRIAFRRVELFKILHQCGDLALPIVSLISLLVGMILAFVGAVQLKAFGAQIYVADLVGIAMVREMGAIMTGIIMAGRTGAAFAAHLGTMNVNEEIDAFRTMSISPVEFLVLPRVLILSLMMPLLCLYANLLGILGGAVVGVGLLDISMAQYLAQTQGAISLSNLWLGLIKSVAFGIIIAVSGCYKGLRSGRSASAVGLAATSAVVSAIVAIIAVDGLFAVMCDVLGI